MGSDGMTLDLIYKQTTSENIKCKLCKGRVDGENGYIKINMDFKIYDGWYSSSLQEKKIVICMKCFNKWLNGITEGEKTKKEDYKKLVRTRILRGLKS